MLDRAARSALPVGFAVVDVETTGFYPTKDRIIEIAVVHVDPAGAVSDTFCTLVDPGRDVGPTHIHGLTASDLVGAPTFAKVAPSLWHWLSGRVLVAHNAPFDVSFLDAELARLGMHLPPPPVMCTMRLSSSYLVGLPGRSLTACCEAAGVSLKHHHNALDDAIAAAQLLAYFRASHPRLPPSWEDALRVAASTVWSAVPATVGFRPVTRGAQVIRRASETPPLTRLVHRLPRGGGGSLDHYLAVLDRVLEERAVTGGELTGLPQVALDLGLTREDAARAHREFLTQVATAAWSHGEVTKGERSDFVALARLLAVPAGQALAILNAPHSQRESPVRPHARLAVGDRVAFTGEMERSRDELEQIARSAGLRVMMSVSGKTALVVVADPHSQSGKARAAREHGVRTVTERVFLQLVAQPQSDGSGDEGHRSEASSGSWTGLPGTELDQLKLLADRPPGWEYMYFGKVLKAELERRDDKFLGLLQHYAPQSTGRMAANEIIPYVSGALKDLTALVAKLTSLMERDVQESAFGAPGQAGDPSCLHDLACRWCAGYEELMDWAATVRGVGAPPEFHRLLELLARFVDTLARQFRDFVGAYVEEVDSLPQRLAAGDPIQINLTLRLTIDDTVASAYRQELAGLSQR